MKTVLIASIGLVVLSIMATAANAQQKSTTVPLVQKYQPVTRSYPGVAADILGIRTGMTVSQAEAIAAKSYPGKLQEYKASDTYTYKEVNVQSQPFVQHVDFAKQTDHTSDTLTLYFSSPVTGNTLYAMYRNIDFEDINKEDPSSALNDPLVSTLQASLIKKYGPISLHYINGARLGWTFTQKSQTICKNEDCMMDSNFLQDNSLNQLEPLFGNWTQLEIQCGMATGSSGVFSIYANIRTNGLDQTKSSGMDVSIWDPATCMDDGKEAVKQLKASAIKFYNTVSKAPAAPKM